MWHKPDFLCSIHAIPSSARHSQAHVVATACQHRTTEGFSALCAQCTKSFCHGDFSFGSMKKKDSNIQIYMKPTITLQDSQLM